MPKTAEGKTQDKSIAYANRLGIRTIRLYFGPGINVGWPDILFLIPGGRPLFIEFKAPGELPTKKQHKKLRLLDEAGYNVHWSDNFDFAKYVIDGALKRARGEK